MEELTKVSRVPLHDIPLHSQNLTKSPTSLSLKNSKNSKNIQLQHQHDDDFKSPLLDKINNNNNNNNNLKSPRSINITTSPAIFKGLQKQTSIGKNKIFKIYNTVTKQQSIEKLFQLINLRIKYNKINKLHLEKAFMKWIVHIYRSNKTNLNNNIELKSNSKISSSTTASNDSFKNQDDPKPLTTPKKRRLEDEEKTNSNQSTSSPIGSRLSTSASKLLSSSSPMARISFSSPQRPLYNQHENLQTPPKSQPRRENANNLSSSKSPVGYPDTLKAFSGIASKPPRAKENNTKKDIHENNLSSNNNITNNNTSPNGKVTPTVTPVKQKSISSNRNIDINIIDTLSERLKFIEENMKKIDLNNSQNVKVENIKTSKDKNLKNDEDNISNNNDINSNEIPFQNVQQQLQRESAPFYIPLESNFDNLHNAMAEATAASIKTLVFKYKNKGDDNKIVNNFSNLSLEEQLAVIRSSNSNKTISPNSSSSVSSHPSFTKFSSKCMNKLGDQGQAQGQQPILDICELPLLKDKLNVWKGLYSTPIKTAESKENNQNNVTKTQTSPI
jgi:hypothetical protein